jgi:hypothetical protein
MPLGRANGWAISGFEATREDAVEVTAAVIWINNDGEIFLNIDGRPTPVYTGYLRQPVNPGEVVTVEGWQEQSGRRRILAQRVTTQDGRQVFPQP